MIRVPVQPDLLRWARERAGRSREDLARRFPKIEAWERGEVQPTFRQLEGFAKATHAPIGYLFLAEPPVESVPIPDFRTGVEAQLGRPSPNLLDMVHLCQQRQNWYRDFVLAVHEPALEFVGSARVGDDVVGTAAVIFRAARREEDGDLQRTRPKAGGWLLIAKLPDTEWLSRLGYSPSTSRHHSLTASATSRSTSSCLRPDRLSTCRL